MADELDTSTPASPTEPASAVTEPATGAEAPAAAPATPPTPEPPAVPDGVDHARVLDEIPAEVLAKHPRVNGILGERQQRARQQWEAEQRAESDRAARERAEQELRDLARQDPYAFAQQWLGKDEQQKLEARINDLQGTTKRELMQQVGQVFGTRYALTPDDVAELTQALSGLPDAEVLPAFTVKATELAARKQAQTLLAEWRDKELPKERDAWKAEYEAERLKTAAVPDLRSPLGVPAGGPPVHLNDDDYNKWYVTQGPGRRLGLSR